MLRFARPAAAGVVVAAFAVVTLAGSALAATKDVSIVDFGFNPATTKVKLGDAVKWTNTGNFTHTSSSDGFVDGQGTVGVNLWASGNISHNAAFSFTFAVAGSFPYHCSIHSTMHGTVNVPLKLPATGSVGVKFKVTWATADPGPDFVFNVQKADPGGAFHNWMTNVVHSVLSATFKPTVMGVYKFRTQLQRVSTGSTSEFSPAKSITVS